MSDEILIRNVRIRDLAAIFELGERLFTARDYPNMYRTWDEFEPVTLFQTSSEHCFAAVTEDDTLVGFALGSTYEKRGTAWNYGYLIWLGVDPDMQHKGIASGLVGAFRQAMVESGVRMMLVDTQADNRRAIAFFKKQGFGSPTRHIYLTQNLSNEF